MEIKLTVIEQLQAIPFVVFGVCVCVSICVTFSTHVGVKFSVHVCV